jgi:MoaA/NifB/PqqE/SkfB family radical SAM enzyme
MHGTDTPHSLRDQNTEAVRLAEATGQAVFDAYPLRLTIEMTADCNLRCPHCEFTPARAWAEKNDPGRILHVGLGDLQRFAAEVFPYIQEIVPSVVGEPMMYPFWDELLDLCEQHGVHVMLYTNGTYFSDATLPRLLQRASRLNISMDGASTETFNHLRHPADFDESVARLDLLDSHRKAQAPEDRPRVAIASVLTLHWVDELVDMVRLAKQHGADELLVAHLLAPTKYWEDHLPGRDAQRTDRNLRAAAEEARRLELTVQLPRLFSSGENLSYNAAPAYPLVDKIVLPPQPENMKYWCSYLWRQLFISIDGTVAPCCGPRRPDVDNLHKTDLKSIFSHPIIARMREGMVSGDLHPVCAKCPQLSMFGELDYERADFTNEYSTLNALMDEQRKGKD